jgi:predicted metal-dependent hydrolase
MKQYKFSKIIECKQIESYEEEYVYDLEMNDKTHTFIANNILVHNSGFLNFGEVIKTCNYKKGITDFILEIYKFRLKDYFKNCLDIYAKKRNTTNIQEFELENISKNVIFLAKKKYISDII